MIMKELSIEQKAKRYDERFVKAKEIHDNENDVLILHTLEDLFPELADSEDEKVRKFLVKWVKAIMPVKPYDNDGFDKETVLAWIEKQGEKQYQKVIEVEHKFKVGDWIVHNTANFVYLIQTIGKEGYGVVSRDGKKFVVRHSEEINYRLWAIQDAKDGDVLADGDLPFIFKKIDTNKYCYAYCGISADDGFRIKSEGKLGEWTWMRDIKPATKEQRDLLFQKMHEAGYEWDVEKLQLKKIEQNPVWSEEDEKIYQSIIG